CYSAHSHRVGFLRFCVVSNPPPHPPQQHPALCAALPQAARSVLGREAVSGKDDDVGPVLGCTRRAWLHLAAKKQVVSRLSPPRVMNKDPRPQSPLFVKTYDFLLWLLPITLKFPKSQRFLLA